MECVAFFFQEGAKGDNFIQKNKFTASWRVDRSESECLAPVVQRPDNFQSVQSISSCTSEYAHSNHSLGVYENLGQR